MKKIFLYLVFLSVNCFSQSFSTDMSHLTNRALVSYWDFGNKLSYPGTGSTVTDLAKTSNATVYNSPTYTASNWGSFGFVKASSQDIRSGTSSLYSPGTANFGYGAVFTATSVAATGTYNVVMGSLSGSNVYDLVVMPTTGYLRAEVSGSTGTNGVVSTTVSVCDGRIYDVFVSRANNVLSMYLNGVLTGTATCTANCNITTTNYISIGSLQAYTDKRYFQGNIFMAYYYAAGLTTYEINSNHSYLTKRKLPFLANIYYEGDSWFANYPLPSKINTQLIADTNNFYSVNYSVGLSTISVISPTNCLLYSARKANVKSAYNPYAPKNICAWFEGVNELRNQVAVNSVSVSVNNTYNAYLAYADSIVKYGFIAVFSSVTPTEFTGTPASYETARQNASNKYDTTTVNGKLRSEFTIATPFPRIFKSNLSKWANCYLLDFGDDPVMGQAGQSTNLTYYQSDFIHPTTRGQDTLTQLYFGPAINGILKNRFIVDPYFEAVFRDCIYFKRYSLN